MTALSALPAELVREALEQLAVDDKISAIALLCVSKAVHLWVLPAFYRTVVLTTRRQVNAFARALRSPQRTVDASPSEELTIGRYVQHLWMGPNHHSPSDLLQSPELNVWPVDAICSILPRCTSLSALAVVNCPEDVWGSIGPLLPASVASIHLGSVRAYMQWDWGAMPCFAALASVTSMELDSVWSPRMYKAVATLPGIRTLRRFFPPTLRDTHCAALRRAAAVEHAESMERVEIVGCMFRSPELAPRWREKCAEASHGAVRPGLFVLRTVDGTIAWEVFFEDWVDHLYWSSRH